MSALSTLRIVGLREILNVFMMEATRFMLKRLVRNGINGMNGEFFNIYLKNIKTSFCSLGNGIQNYVYEWRIAYR